MIDRLGANAVPIQLPIGAEADFVGIIDLVGMKAIVYKDDLGKEFDVIEIPAELADAAEAAREHLLEEVSHYDDELVELILEDAEIPVERAQGGDPQGDARRSSSRRSSAARPSRTRASSRCSTR